MKNVLSVTFFFIITLTYVHSLDLETPVLRPRDECSDPVPDSCSFYVDCLEDRNFDCGPSGYPLAYGQVYCEKFEAAKPFFSAKGQIWVSDTMLCLQQALIPEATGAADAVQGCAALSTKAFGTHAECYVQSGLCGLGVSDWLIIIETVGITNLFASANEAQATFQAIKDCIMIWGGRR